MPKLIVVHRPTHREQVYTLHQDQIALGRSEDCDIVLSERSVSRHHAEIAYDRHDYYLVDLESGNGTRLNTTRLHAGERQLLRSNDIISIEPFDIHFISDIGTGEEPSHFDDEITDTDIIEIKMIKKVLKALDDEMVPSLQVASGEHEGKKISITPDMSECTIGRDDHCGFPIPDSSVSRTHAVLRRKWGGIAIADLDSKNGTFVNGERVQEKLLSDGDQVVVGTVKLVYRNPKDVSMSAINREYEASSPVAQVSEATAATPTIPASAPTAAAETPVAAPAGDQAIGSDSAQATAEAERGKPPPDDDLEDIFGAPKENEIPKKDKKKKAKPSKPLALPKLKLPTASHVLWVLLALGGAVFVTALLTLAWLLLK